MDARFGWLQRLDDRGQRQDQGLAGDAHHHDVEHRQGQRQAHGESRAGAGARGYADPPAERLDRPLDHVHADAAAGNVRYGFGGGEAGREYQVVDLVVAEDGVRRDKTFAYRDFLHPRPVDPGAVVGDFDDDAARAMQRAQANDAYGRLSGRDPFGRILDAVIDSVADHVGERVREALDDGLVHLGVLAVGDQMHRFAGDLGDFADDARHALEDRLDRLGADRHHAVLDFASQALELVDQVDQPVDPVDIDADRRLGGVRGGGRLAGLRFRRRGLFGGRRRIGR